MNRNALTLYLIAGILGFIACNYAWHWNVEARTRYASLVQENQQLQLTLALGTRLHAESAMVQQRLAQALGKSRYLTTRDEATALTEIARRNHLVLPSLALHADSTVTVTFTGSANDLLRALNDMNYMPLPISPNSITLSAQDKGVKMVWDGKIVTADRTL